MKLHAKGNHLIKLSPLENHFILFHPPNDKLHTFLPKLLLIKSFPQVIGHRTKIYILNIFPKKIKKERNQ